MAPESSIARLNGTYRTTGTYRGQTGTLWSTNTRSARTPSQVVPAHPELAAVKAPRARRERGPLR